MQHSFELLSGVQNTCILGRDLLSKFGALEFEWLNHQVRVCDVWKNPHITLEGAEPLVKPYLAESFLSTYQECNDSISTVAGETNSTRPGFNINPGLSNQQKYKLINMLRELSGVFAENPKCPSIAKEVKHKIDTGDAQPIKQRIYPVAPAIEEEIMTQVTDMISNGICRPSNSPWASRVLLMSKRDGNRRFCVDFRELNKVTRSDSYPCLIRKIF